MAIQELYVKLRGPPGECPWVVDIFWPSNLFPESSSLKQPQDLVPQRPFLVSSRAATMVMFPHEQRHRYLTLLPDISFVGSTTVRREKTFPVRSIVGLAIFVTSDKVVVGDLLDVSASFGRCSFPPK